MGCTVGKLNLTMKDVFQGNVIASKNSTVNYTKIQEEAWEAKKFYHDYKMTDEDRALEQKVREETEEKIDKLFEKKIQKTVAFDYYLNVDDFTKFLLENPKLQSASDELQYVYYYSSKLFDDRLLIYECHRSKEDQLKAFEKGASKVKLGWHNFGMACDSITVENRKAKWKDIPQAIKIATIHKAVCNRLKKDKNGFKNLRCRSGMDFKSFKDFVHFELRPKKFPTTI